MVNKIAKAAPYLAAGFIAYLAYTVTEATNLKKPDEKNAPGITKKMLQPTFLTAEVHASPPDRDPFEVEWSSYRRKMAEDALANQMRLEAMARTGTGAKAAPAASTTAAAPGASGAVAAPASSGPSATVEAAAVDPTPEPPKLPPSPSSIFIQGDRRAVVIDQQIYHEGEFVGGKDAVSGWLLEKIAEDAVVLRFGGVRMRMSFSTPPSETKTGPSKSKDAAP